MDLCRTAQDISSVSEETASAAEELNAQADEMNGFVDQLAAMVSGTATAIPIRRGTFSRLNPEGYSEYGQKWALPFPKYTSSGKGSA